MDIDWRGIRRVAVVGPSGAGKSTLTRVIADATGLPAIHLDQHHWQPGWTEPDPAEWRARVMAMGQGERWVIDGNYDHDLMRDRLARADLTILLDRPTAVCMWRVLKRLWTHRGRARPDMGPGCPERFNLEFLHFVLTFRRRRLPKLLQSGATAPGPVLRLQRERDVRRLLATLPAGERELEA